MPKCSNHKCKICSKYGLLDHKISLLTLCLLLLSVTVLVYCFTFVAPLGRRLVKPVWHGHDEPTPPRLLLHFKLFVPVFPLPEICPLGTPESIRQCSQGLSYPGHLNLCETEFSRKQYGGPLLLNFRVELIWRSYKAMQTISQTVNWYINFTIQTLARVLEGANT